MNPHIGEGKLMSILNASNFINDVNFIWNGKKGITLCKLKLNKRIIPKGTECYIHGKVKYTPFNLFPFYKKEGLEIESPNHIYIKGINPRLIEIIL